MNKKIFDYYNNRISRKYKEIEKIENEIKKLKEDYKRETEGKVDEEKIFD